MSVPRYCPFCAAAAEADWVFCQACARRLPGKTIGAMEGRDERVAEMWQTALRHMETGDYEDAEASAAQLMDLGCDAGDHAALLGSIALRRSQIHEAHELLDRALEESPHSPFVRLKRSEYWRAIGLMPNAVAELQEALRHAESERVREELRRILDKTKKESRWNFPRASPFARS